MKKRVLEVECVYTRSEDCRVGARATGDEMISGRQGWCLTLCQSLDTTPGEGMDGDRESDESLVCFL